MASTANVSDKERSQLAYTYAALILHDEGTEITSEKMEKLVKAAGVQT
jgi:ribosomal protein L12E/L44/L45/RPP1/RPP2